MPATDAEGSYSPFAAVRRLLEQKRFREAEQVADHFLTAEQKARLQPGLKPKRDEADTFRRVWKETH